MEASEDAEIVSHLPSQFIFLHIQRFGLAIYQLPPRALAFGLA
jgi:hypothetical protein